MDWNITRNKMEFSLVLSQILTQIYSCKFLLLLFDLLKMEISHIASAEISNFVNTTLHFQRSFHKFLPTVFWTSFSRYIFCLHVMKPQLETNVFNSFSFLLSFFFPFQNSTACTCVRTWPDPILLSCTTQLWRKVSLFFLSALRFGGFSTLIGSKISSSAVIGCAVSRWSRAMNNRQQLRVVVAVQHACNAREQLCRLPGCRAKANLKIETSKHSSKSLSMRRRHLIALLPCRWIFNSCAIQFR